MTTWFLHWMTAALVALILLASLPIPASIAFSVSKSLASGIGRSLRGGSQRHFLPSGIAGRYPQSAGATIGRFILFL